MTKQLWSSVTATVLTTLIGTASAATAQSSLQTDAIAVETTASETTTTVAIAPSTTEIYSHTMGTSPAVTLYVHNIPVLTFLGESEPETAASTFGFLTPDQVIDGDLDLAETDPLWRAAIVADRINQLSPEAAAQLTLKWNKEQETYLVMLEDETITSVDTEHILPDSTNNWDQDALQVTNRLRRLLGGAGPLAMGNIVPRPRYRATIEPNTSAQPTGQAQRGMASWYGPGFHGRRSASGERFNQNALTAAHRTLPFGTQVRVTNLNSGTSVVVRINDRGPFIHGRVIDLSRAAAGAIGMLGSGVAPVQLEVLR
jgi:rare lipoprotein A